jgi:thiamine biosynthesis lipoprotein
MRDPDCFRSMGCVVIVSGASDPELQAVKRLFERRNRTFSRFVGGSELNRVNRSAGRPIEVSSEFTAMLGLARRAERETGGLVTPRLGSELEAAGYDRDFELLGDDPRPALTPPREPRDICLDGRTLRMGENTKIDLNGIVKSRTVDDALLLVRGPGWVAAGGDLATRGPVSVGLPYGGSVALVEGGLATSGTDCRRWLRAGVPQHHLIDPRTRAPAVSPWQQVTACGASCMSADVAAKWALLLGPAGPICLDRYGIPARFVSATGTVHLNTAWRRSVAEAACI